MFPSWEQYLQSTAVNSTDGEATLASHFPRVLVDSLFDPATSNDYAQLEPQLAAAILEIIRDIVIGVDIFQSLRIKCESDAQHFPRTIY